MKKLSSQNRSSLIRLASSLAKGSTERRAILASLKRAAAPKPKAVPGFFDPLMDYPNLYRFLKGDWENAVIELAELWIEGGDDPFAVARKYEIPGSLSDEWEELFSSIRYLYD